MESIKGKVDFILSDLKLEKDLRYPLNLCLSNNEEDLSYIF